MPAQLAQPTAERAARRILAVVALIQVFLFASAARNQFRAVVSPSGSSRPQVVGATVGGIDCHGYYAWLRSPLIDGDWDFTNEFQFYQAHWPNSNGPLPRTPTGRMANQWSVGPAIVWSVAVVPVHFALSVAGADAEEPRGYSPPYQLAIGLVTLALSFATLLFAYRIALTFAPPVAAAAAAGMVVLGTPILAYGTVAGGMAHGPASAALAAYVCVWLRTFGGARFARWLGVGLLLGFACLMRWQLATFAVLPALEAAWLARRDRRLTRPPALLSCAALGSLIGFVPQMVAWSAVYGRPLVNPHSTRAAWLDPSFWPVLFSPDRSLFYWTPVALLGVLGLCFACRRGQSRSAPARMLLVAAAIQVYAIAAIYDRGIFLGASFGFRLLTETCVVLVVGLAAVFRLAGAGRTTFVAAACGAAVCWNLLLIQVSFHAFPGAESGPAGLVNAVLRYCARRPLEAAVWGALAAGLALQLRQGLLLSAPVPVEPALRPGFAGFLTRLLRGFRSGIPS